MSVDIAEQPSPEPSGGPRAEGSAAGAGQVLPRRGSKTRSRLVQILSIAALAVLLVFLWRYFGATAKKAPASPRGQAVPVEVASVTQRDVPIQIKGIGNVEALSTISVRSQITGTLEAVLFTPGQVVRKGALLFRIDPRPLQAALNQEQANLIKAVAAVKQAQALVARDQATANNSRSLAQRDVRLVETGVISSQDYDNAVSKAQSDEAVVTADKESVANLQSAVKAQQAIVDNAKVQLSYTDIRSPIDGKTGNLDVTAGNLAQPGSTTPLVTITQTSPIYVTFSIPEQELSLIRRYHGSSDLTVQASIPGDDSPANGRLSLVDNTVDPATGTIKMKATFLNGDGRLFPGQYVNVVLTLGVQRGATTVPSQAVQIGQDQPFVYVVKPDMTAEVRKVRTGDALDNMTVIEEGLQPGEQVVTDGQLALTPGAKVQIGSGRGQQRGANAGSGGVSGGGTAGPGGQGSAAEQGAQSGAQSGQAGPGNPGSQGGSGNPGGQGGQSGQGASGGQGGQGGQGGTSGQGSQGGSGQGGQGGSGSQGGPGTQGGGARGGQGAQGGARGGTGSGSATGTSGTGGTGGTAP